MSRLLFLPLLMTLCLCQSANAGDTWPQFRGPGSAGVVEDDPSLPEVWSATQNVAWKVPVPGRAWSSPIVWKDKVFLTSAVQDGETEEPQKGLYLGGERPAPENQHRWMVYCLDANTGQILWEREAHKGVPGPRHLKNSYASETPATDGELVYAYFGNTGLFVYDLEGNPKWSKSWDPVEMKSGWGTASSPILHKNRLYIVNDNDTQSYMVCLDTKTGEQVWRVDREEKSNWTTPYIWENEKRTEVVTHGSIKARSYDLDGKPLWELGGQSKITVSTPFSKFGLLYLSSGFVRDTKKPLFAVRPGASGDITPPEGQSSSEFVAWVQPLGASYNTSPVVYGDTIYVLYDRGFFCAFDARTGKEHYEQQRLGRGTAFTASPWAYNGKVFCLTEEGNTMVLQAGSEFKQLYTNPLGEMALATPAIANDSLFIRTENNLFRIKK